MIELGLQRISRLLARTPLSWRAIHVAGTNGKGSICAYISGMLDVYNNSNLRANTGHRDLRHGRFTSPHLIDRWDCITIDQQPVRSSIFREVENAVLERNKREAIGASEFEILTATAFEIFNREQIDVGVVEVGMGGRLDATNIIGHAENDKEAIRPLPLVTVVSNIGLDHQDYLGDTLGAIAKEKAGILKPGIPVVYDSSNAKEVMEVLYQVAEEKGCPIAAGRRDMHGGEPFLSVDEDCIGFPDSTPGSPASHIRENVDVALSATWLALRQLGRLPMQVESRPLDDYASELALRMRNRAFETKFPGRQQMISIERLTGREDEVLLDGAHNAESALALARRVEELRNESTSHSSVTWVIAMSSTKDGKSILSPLLKNGDTVVAVEFGPVDGMPWVKPYESAQLLEAAKAIVSDPGSLRVHDCGTDVLGALKLASKEAANGPLVIAGSLYLVGDVLRLLRDD